MEQLIQDILKLLGVVAFIKVMTLSPDEDKKHKKQCRTMFFHYSTRRIRSKIMYPDKGSRM